MCWRYAVRILLAILAILAILAAVFPVQAANVAVGATKEVASEEWAGATSRPPLSSDQSPSSPDPKVGIPQGSKAVQTEDPKQETPVQPASAGARGATNSAKSTASNSNNSKNITFTPGFRLQVRYIHDRESGKNEFFVARLRLKAKGELFHTVRYYTELKIDTLGRSGKNPTAELENAWLEYSVAPNLAIRAGLYDAPFSRNALTSDSKLLLIDRSLIKDALTSVGFADNTTGLLGHGRPFKGRLEYSLGMFNNEKFRKIGAPGANQSAYMMPAGRIVYDFLDPAPRGGYADYQSSYVGKGKRLSLGANSAYLRKARDTVNEFNLLGWGTDLFFSTGPFTVEAEYDRLRKELIGGNPAIQVDGWYVQAGYLVWRRVEFAARHQQLDPNVFVPNNRLRWTSVGSNIYFRKHNVKMQLEYTFRRGPGQAVKTDVLQMQMQVDF